jgi:hypothetical protein
VKVIEEEPAPHIVQDSDKTKTEDAQFKTTNTPETNTPENQPTKGRYAMPIIVNGDTEYDYYSNYVQNYAMVSDGKDGNVKVSAIQDRNYDYRDNRLKNPITIVPHETPLIADGDDHYDIYLGNLDSNNHFIYCSKSKSILGVDQENIHKAIRATYLESALAQENGTTINQTTTTTYIDNQGVSSVLVIPVLPLPSYFHGHLHSHHGHGPMPIPPPPPMRGKGHNYGGNRPPAPRPKGTSYGDNRPPASRPQGTSYESNRPPASRPQGTSYEGNRPPASKPQGTSYGGNRPPALKPQGTSYGGNRQSIQIPTPMKSTPNSGGNRPSKPKNQTPNYGSSRPSVQIPTPKPTPNYGGSRPSTPKPGPSIGGYSQSTPKPKPQTPKLQQPKQQNFKPKNTNSGNNNGQRKPKPNQYQNKGKSR